MRALILGGTWLLGRLVASDFLRRGFDVTVFNQHPDRASLPDGVRHLSGDRTVDEDLRAVAKSGPWHVVVDISGKVPATVSRSARALADAAEHYLSVSTNMVYRDWPEARVDEDSPVRDCDPDFEPANWSMDPEFYGAMKAGCEAACRAAFGDDRVLILRLHRIIGQHEDIGPMLWWLNRMRRGGQVLVPAPDRAIQPIDVRDVSSFMVHLAEQRTTGVLNVASPPGGRTLGDLVRACAAVVDGPPYELVWAGEDWLTKQGVQQLTELPLWSREPAHWDMSVERAVAAGLRCRPLIDTAAETWRWLSTGDRAVTKPRIAAYGMDPAREAELTTRWIALQGS
jgi:2'-hydroxyisoflavone reductase